jgi:hypothetical protein
VVDEVEVEEELDDVQVVGMHQPRRSLQNQRLALSTSSPSTTASSSPKSPAAVQQQLVNKQRPLSLSRSAHSNVNNDAHNLAAGQRVRFVEAGGSGSNNSSNNSTGVRPNTQQPQQSKSSENILDDYVKTGIKNSATIERMFDQR